MLCFVDIVCLILFLPGSFLSLVTVHCELCHFFLLGISANYSTTFVFFIIFSVTLICNILEWIQVLFNKYYQWQHRLHEELVSNNNRIKITPSTISWAAKVSKESRGSVLFSTVFLNLSSICFFHKFFLIRGMTYSFVSSGSPFELKKKKQKQFKSYERVKLHCFKNLFTIRNDIFVLHYLTLKGLD